MYNSVSLPPEKGTAFASLRTDEVKAAFYTVVREIRSHASQRGGLNDVPVIGRCPCSDSSRRPSGLGLKTRGDLHSHWNVGARAPC